MKKNYTHGAKIIRKQIYFTEKNYYDTKYQLQVGKGPTNLIGR